MTPDEAKRLEAEIEEEWVQGLMLLARMSGSELLERDAMQQARIAIDLCKKQAAEVGSDREPDHLGDRILEQARAGNKFRQKMLEDALREGATIQDFLHWWNLPDLRRRVIGHRENSYRYATFKSLVEQGLTSEKAAEQVRRGFPMYGSPTDIRHTKGDDRPLPLELWARINQVLTTLGPTECNRRALSFSTCNAWLRSLIRAGSL